MKTKMKQGVVRDTKYMIKFIWNLNKSLVMLKIFMVIINAAQLAINTYYIKIIIDAILNFNEIKDIIILICILQIISISVYIISNYVGKRIIPKKEYIVRNKLQNDFVKKAMEQDLANYENYSFYDNYTKAIRYADTKALDILNILIKFIGSAVSIIFLLSLFGVMDYILLGFILVTIVITLVDQIKSSRCSHELHEAEESINRKMEYLKKVAHHRQYSKEVRIFHLHEFVIKKLNETFDDKFKAYKKNNSKYWNIKLRVALLNTLLVIPAVLGYIAYKTFIGEFTIGDFSMIFAAIFSISNHVSSMLFTWSQLQFESEFYVSKLRQILDYKPLIEGTGNVDIDPKSIHKIEFRNVSFSYPGHEKEVLSNISFIIEKGCKLAIVGKNGAGKSTIIKLLLRLYDVTGGIILVDNINIKEYKIEKLRDIFSTILQDYNIYAFTVGENILFDEVVEMKREQIYNALNFVGLDEKTREFPHQENSYITREFDEEGIELSGGETQKLAIARAVARDTAMIILDEANSSLDPIAEYQINKKIMTSLSEKGAIFVSHRLSTTTYADKIILINEGTIAEEGSHSELMNAGGLYHDMFLMQAEAYDITKKIKKYE
ncbi:ABC transporter ATP-binding protein/permease [Acholeplasma sp. OttesenSCG-928-E16]|nr:ABC transporter ATP-binding protein/permease [Acholeplasma sp. OttesenSCG-928-E16]